MDDFGARGPLGQRTPKTPKEPRKPFPKQSPKRIAYMSSAARKEGVAHMLAVKALPCICCGHPPPSHAHHVTGDKMPRNDMRVLPLCHSCHQGDHGYHAAKATWVARHGPDYGLLARVDDLIEKPPGET